ncbi:MAG: alanine/glycine:cation symporter family protein [Psychrilyobacter sp.]|uniref:alanine/glycine:cation symporter family protein n=1 Tax=Psychrilyobacter sp. TaxID=2586924 RepID=UPI003C76FE1D
MENFINQLNGIIWSPLLVYLCLGAGLFFTLKIKVSQISMVKEMLRLLFGKDVKPGERSKDSISGFEAMCMSVSGRVGTGNIAGVATAISLGGPGSIFWLWVISVLGAASSYVESTLGQLYKEEFEGTYRGGPAYYFKKGLLGGKAWYGNLFAIVTVTGMSLLMPSVQSNVIASSMHTATGLPKWITGAIIVAVLAVIVFGGAKRIAKFASIVVPFMAIAYIIIAVIVLILNASDIIPSLSLIVRSAFGQEQAFAGIVGTAVMWGVKRGIYSNEAGQGTGPASAAAADTSHPAKQGLIQAFSIYIDSIFVCTATALMIIITGAYKVFAPSGKEIYSAFGASTDMTASTIGPLNTTIALDAGIGYGAYIVAIAIMFFAFTTILAYFWNGDSAAIYLLGNSSSSKNIRKVLTIIFLTFTFIGTIITGGMAWTLGDIGVGMMAWVNIVGILIMHKPAILCLKDYKARMKKGTQDNWDFNPNEIGIEGDFKLWDGIRAEERSQEQADVELKTS